MQDQGTFYFTYDTENRYKTCTGENGYFRAIVYDEFGRIVQDTTSDGEKSIVYNDLNQRVAESDYEGNWFYYDHDDAGNMTEISYPDGTTEEYTYNTYGQVTRCTDREGGVTRYTYNENHHLEAVTDPRDNTTLYTVDDNGNRLTATDPLGDETINTYDAASNSLTSTDALKNTTTYVFRIITHPLPCTQKRDTTLSGGISAACQKSTVFTQ